MILVPLSTISFDMNIHDVYYIMLYWLVKLTLTYECTYHKIYSGEDQQTSRHVMRRRCIFK
jgi:hypothetical protein